jgi:very-short-patch-repair endonuclease
MPERFFVKNLENVQGDERDVILLAIGYGKRPNGSISMNFGPLNKPGGERRLNVAVTRARHSMVVVSSMQSHDIDLSRTQTRGPILLKAFLDYAERGPVALTAAVESEGADFDSVFEKQVYDELTSRGLCLHQQIGCSGYRIDLAIVDPDKPGEYQLGIECDGATYHSSATARDRDRLRQRVLEDLGWKICRIWSTDWIRNPETQVRKVLKALNARSEPQQASSNPDLLSSKHLIIPKNHDSEVSEYQFGDIDEVPDSLISSLMLSILRNYGDTGEVELCKAVSVRLGFQRMGHRIEGRLTTLMHELISEGKAALRSDGRVHLKVS